jgi:hypothetical protein
MKTVHGNLSHAMRDNYDEHGVDEVDADPALKKCPAHSLLSIIVKSHRPIATRSLPASKRQRAAAQANVRYLTTLSGTMDVHESMVGGRRQKAVRRGSRRKSRSKPENTGYGGRQVREFLMEDASADEDQWGSHAMSLGMGRLWQARYHPSSRFGWTRIPPCGTDHADSGTTRFHSPKRTQKPARAHDWLFWPSRTISWGSASQSTSFL